MYSRKPFPGREPNKSIVNHTFHNFTQAARERDGAVVVWIGCVFGRFRYRDNSRSTYSWIHYLSLGNPTNGKKNFFLLPSCWLSHHAEMWQAHLSMALSD